MGVLKTCGSKSELSITCNTSVSLSLFFFLFLFCFLLPETKWGIS